MLQHLTKVLLLGALLLTACESKPNPDPATDPVKTPAASLPDVADAVMASFFHASNTFFTLGEELAMLAAMLLA